MFSGLSDKLTNVFDGLKRKAVLREEDVNDALGEIRLALLEADVALHAVKSFIAEVKERAVGVSAIKSVSAAQQVVKIVHDAMIHMLASDFDEEGKSIPATLNLIGAKPNMVLMVGLQGSGKTTSSAKLAYFLKHKQNKKALLASLDVHRPAAQEQLAQLATQYELNALPIIAGQSALDIAKRALQAGKLGGYDLVILDSAGRTSLNEELMLELTAIKQATNPSEILMVADSMTGQDAAKTGLAFHERLSLSGIILTRIDGDARGGAALSMRHVTGASIKFIGVGEKIDALESFDAERIAGRILDMGDIVSLVEKAASTIEEEDAERLAKKMQKGRFDLNDMAMQLQQMKKLGGAGAVLGLMPGMGKMMKQVDQSKLDGKSFARQEAIISSMTKAERRNPDLLHASRKRRIAAGSGTNPNEINRLLKQHATMAKMMKQMSNGGGGLMGALSKMMDAGGGLGGGNMGGGGMNPAALMQQMEAGGGLGAAGMGGGLGAAGMGGLGGGNKETERKAAKARAKRKKRK